MKREAVHLIILGRAQRHPGIRMAGSIAVMGYLS
jgi:hypothetical protein